MSINSGVKASSLPSAGESYYIIGIPNGDLSRTQKVLSFDNPINHKMLRGRWEGVDEDCFIINAKDYYRASLRLAVYMQKCVLHLGPLVKGRRAATFFDTNGLGDIISAGTFAGDFYETTKECAEKQNAFTLDPSTGCYYIIGEMIGG